MKIVGPSNRTTSKQIAPSTPSSLATRAQQALSSPPLVFAVEKKTVVVKGTMDMQNASGSHADNDRNHANSMVCMDLKPTSPCTVADGEEFLWQTRIETCANTEDSTAASSGFHVSIYSSDDNLKASTMGPPTVKASILQDDEISKLCNMMDEACFVARLGKMLPSVTNASDEDNRKDPSTSVAYMAMDEETTNCEKIGKESPFRASKSKKRKRVESEENCQQENCKCKTSFNKTDSGILEDEGSDCRFLRHELSHRDRLACDT